MHAEGVKVNYMLAAFQSAEFKRRRAPFHCWHSVRIARADGGNDIIRAPLLKVRISAGLPAALPCVLRAGAPRLFGQVAANYPGRTGQYP